MKKITKLQKLHNTGLYGGCGIIALKYAQMYGTDSFLLLQDEKDEFIHVWAKIDDEYFDVDGASSFIMQDRGETILNVTKSELLEHISATVFKQQGVISLLKTEETYVERILSSYVNKPYNDTKIFKSLWEIFIKDTK